MTSSINEILDAMRATNCGGLTFFNRIPGLPPLTFIGEKSFKDLILFTIFGLVFLSFFTFQMYANLVILATPERIIGHQVVCLGHLGGFVAF